MRVELTLIGMFWLAFLFSACAGSKDPVGPDTAVFSLNVEPPIITTDQNAVLSLNPTLPLDFEGYYGELILFSSSSDYGVFTPAFYSLIINDLGTGYLNPQIWYQYGGPPIQDTLDITIYGHVITLMGDTLAWNHCQIEIVPN